MATLFLALGMTQLTSYSLHNRSELKLHQLLVIILFVIQKMYQQTNLKIHLEIQVAKHPILNDFSLSLFFLNNFVQLKKQLMIKLNYL